MENSRTKNTVLNSVFGIIGYVAVIIVSFILRKVLASILGSEYLGLNSLYTNIVSFLSLTELGLSTAIVYFLYKPISDGDENKVKAYLEFYKKAYRIIALIVFIVGCALISVYCKDNRRNSQCTNILSFVCRQYVGELSDCL